MIDQFPAPPELPRQFRNPDPKPRDVDDPLAWQVDALCAQVGSELFFPEQGGASKDAKKICAACDVRAQCLQYALDNDERYGLWGGVSERQRRKYTTKTIEHGTNAMYGRGCRDESTCPRNAKGTSCSEAHRAYEKRWYRRHQEGAA